ERNDRRAQLPEPDRRRGKRLGEVERHPLFGQIAADHRHAEDESETEREADRDQSAGGGDDIRGGEARHPRDEDQDERHEREHGRGDEDRRPLREIAAGDGEYVCHELAPSPATAMKISSSDMAETSAL